MDPISQGTIAAAAAQTRSPSTDNTAPSIWSYTIFGALAGMAPDLDVLIQSPTDPLLFLEYHRHFTHSLVFIPIGAFIVTAAVFKLFKHGLTFKQAYLTALLAYATHGLLDACTSYGTQLLWPFTDYRVTWNNISVVDPLFTLPLLGCVVWAVKTKNIRWTYLGLLWVFSYLLFGVWQLDRASDGAAALAESRGHTPHRLTMKPSFGNMLVWKSIYEHDGRYYVDGIRVGASTTICPGDSAEKLVLDKHLPDLISGSQQAQDVERFRWFSQDYLAPVGDAGIISDMRYSMVPNEINPMWGVRFRPGQDAAAHIEWWSARTLSDAQRSKFYAMLSGASCQPL